MRLVELARVPPLPATSSWRCDSIYEMESLAFLQNASLVIHSSRAVVSSPRSSSVQSFHVSPQRIAPTMRDAKTKLPYDSRFSRPNRQTRPQWEPPAIEQPVPSVVEDPLPSIDAGESGSSAESMSLSNDNLVESNEIVQGEDIISNDNRGIGGNDVGGNDIVQADGMTPIDDGDIARNGVGRNENVQEDDSTPLDDEAIANNDVESNEIVQADDMSVNDDGGTSRNDAERKESVHTDDMSLSSGGAVAGSGVEVNEIVQEEDMVLIDDGGNSDDGDEGNGSDDGNGGNDDNGESDGEDDERNELTRILRLTEEEGKRATMEQLRSIEAASRIPVIGSLALSWPALRDRLAANRRLPLQMGVEITVGVVTKTIAELNGRGDRFWKEFDFYLSDMALEIFGDAILVWLLSPAALLRGSGVGMFGYVCFLLFLLFQCERAGHVTNYFLTFSLSLFLCCCRDRGFGPFTETFHPNRSVLVFEQSSWVRL